MFKIDRLTTEYLEGKCVTDNLHPIFRFTLISDRRAVKVRRALFTVGSWQMATDENFAVYDGELLMPLTEYKISVVVENNYGEIASAEMKFSTGFMSGKLPAEWITDGGYCIGNDKSSPVPMTFRKSFACNGNIKKATLFITSIGIYCAYINGQRVGQDYLTPGFTAYDKRMQYQTYGIGDMLAKQNTIEVAVAGGWACGSYTNKRCNKLYADRQALKAILKIEYDDGTSEDIVTDGDWQVAQGYRFVSADIYDGEKYDASMSAEDVGWKGITIETPRIFPELIADCGAPVRKQQKMSAECIIRHPDGRLIYDFKQNFAGIVSFKVNGVKGQKIVIRHAEIITNGELHTSLLRSAKAMLEYVCRDGEQQYSPTFTYMGFRYIEVSGVEEEDIEICAYVLHSDIAETGYFECSDQRINRLQQNIVFSAKSNFVDIPTDCPQRDERMGWTGDIAVFAPTACFNFDMSRFFSKWLTDMRAEQGEDGGIPDVIPAPPKTFSPATKAFWGDACVLVPYAQYMQSGDIRQLVQAYPSMKKYLDGLIVKAERVVPFKPKYILCTYITQAFRQYGEWCAPDCGYYGWMLRSKWTATASLKNLLSLVAKIAHLLGDITAYKRYKCIAEKVSRAYVKEFTNGKGRLKKEFQTAYVLPLKFDMFSASDRCAAAENLVRLVRKNDHKVMTGFPGTPYILSVLVDNGYTDDAYRMLTNENCPSWLYEVKTGGTSIWERWDALKEDGSININEKDKNVMISFNHYASGAVGNFLYEKILGISPANGGYRAFGVMPVQMGDISSAKGYTNTCYGRIAVDWSLKEGRISVSVPVGATCHIRFMDIDKVVESGNYVFKVKE